MDVIGVLRNATMFLNLMSPECFEDVVVKLNMENTECLLAFLSKALGLAIILGSTLVKLPQVFKILRAGSAEGLSFIGVLLELLAVTANGAYSFSQGFPFSAYGEAVFLSLQTSLIAVLVLWYGSNTVGTLLFSSIYGFTVFAITQPSLVPAEILWYGQAANIPMIVVGKLIQVMTNVKNGHTGQLSAVTVFLLAAGSLARIFTSIRETGDRIVILTYVCSSSTNVLLALQVVYYWNATKVILEGKKKLSHKKRN